MISGAMLEDLEHYLPRSMRNITAEERMQNAIEELEQENRLLRARNDRLEAEAKAVSVQERCEYCDGTGDVHDRAGEWRGVCNCEAGKRFAAPVQDEAWKAEQKALADAAIKCAKEAIADVNGPIKAVREYYGATPPAAQQPWVELTDRQIESIFIDSGWSWGGKADMYVPAVREVLKLFKETNE